MIIKKKDEEIWTNQQIQTFMLDTMNMPNFCDRIQHILKNEKDYEYSSFYKETKIKLLDLYKAFREDQLFSPENFLNYVQKNINNLDLSNLNKILDQFNQETKDTYNQAISAAKEVGMEDMLKEAGIVK
jgi:hypothetical protein